MKVLIACEYSGIVRNTFTAAVHNAQVLIPPNSRELEKTQEQIDS